MQLQRLHLTGFRSYQTLDAVFPPGPQLVIGRNAAGKTNLLESIVLLGLGRSHRSTTDADMIGWGQPFARLEGDVVANPEPDEGLESSGSSGASALVRLEVVLTRPGSGAARKRVKINGVARRAAALARALRVVVFAPEEMLLVVGSPSLRRSALDMLVAQLEPTASATMSTYARALQQRNNLLRAIRDGLAAPDELSYWNEVVCVEGGRIVGWRLDALDRMAGPLREAHREIAPDEGPLSLRYLTNSPAEPGEAPEDALARRLLETADKERWNGATLVGPHRDDIAFELEGRDLAGFASRGQQRTAILAFKLAQLDLLQLQDGDPPLLLLDDVFSELDPRRRAHLVSRISQLPQAFVTTTTADDLDPRLVARSTTWTVEEGAMRRATR